MLSSLFASRAYYAFGFLALTAGVVSLTTATVSILFTYFVLCAEEYRCVTLLNGRFDLSERLITSSWHWRAFLAGGGSAFWLFAYGIFYWISRLTLGSLSSVILYMGYLLLLSLLTFLVTGKALPIDQVDTPSNKINDRHNRLPCHLLGCTEALRRHPHRLNNIFLLGRLHLANNPSISLSDLPLPFFFV